LHNSLYCTPYTYIVLLLTHFAELTLHVCASASTKIQLLVDPVPEVGYLHEIGRTLVFAPFRAPVRADPYEARLPVLDADQTAARVALNSDLYVKGKATKVTHPCQGEYLLAGVVTSW
jgi:hypothetical protein